MGEGLMVWLPGGALVCWGRLVVSGDFRLGRTDGR